ncbi:hypothetical protein NKI04_29090, partial [Mesorhizobium sp. M0814]
FLLIFFHHKVSTYFGGHLMHQSTQQQKVRGNSRLRFNGLIADKTFNSIADLNEPGAKIVISQHPRRASPLPLDKELYKWRHLIENFCANSRSSSAWQWVPTKPIIASQPSSTSQASS